MPGTDDRFCESPDDDSQTVHCFQYDRTEPRSLSVTLIDAIEAVAGAERGEPLYHSVDPDALDAIFAPTPGPNADVSVEFNHYGYDVVVDGDEICIVELDDTDGQ